jgi:hypothetical protein
VDDQTGYGNAMPSPANESLSSPDILHRQACSCSNFYRFWSLSPSITFGIYAHCRVDDAATLEVCILWDQTHDFADAEVHVVAVVYILVTDVAVARQDVHSVEANGPQPGDGRGATGQSFRESNAPERMLGNQLTLPTQYGRVSILAGPSVFLLPAR